jgi:hypothetical protein
MNHWKAIAAKGAAIAALGIGLAITGFSQAPPKFGGPDVVKPMDIGQCGAFCVGNWTCGPYCVDCYMDSMPFVAPFCSGCGVPGAHCE